MRVMMKITFIVTFFNTAFISLLDTASFVEIDGGTGFLSNIFSSSTMDQTDFSQIWYRTAGFGLILNMVLSAVLPIVDFLFSYLISRCERCCDRSLTSNENQTK
jgi:hypothetical protein